MAEQENFKGFFSYARHDGETDPALIAALTTDLGRRINARLVNARLTIWLDTERLKAGERWDETIDGELRSADVLIVLLTPLWIGSEYCRKEFTLFEELETSRQIGHCVVPILARPIAQQKRRLTPEQRDIFDRINQRQHFQALAMDFLKLPSARRNSAAIIERLSDLPRPVGNSATAKSTSGGAPEPADVDLALARGPLTLRTAGQDGAADMPDLAVFRDAPFAPELVVIPAGEFLMGSPAGKEGRLDSEGPQHQVTIAQRFAIGRYPVTFREYVLFCIAKQRKKPGDEGWGRKRRPVINVSWQDVQDYIAWLSQETRKAYRLPSEAEWEYACRAGTATRYSFGAAITPKDANYHDSGLRRTSEVGAYPANPWGLHDMHGNVWEWVEDEWHKNCRGAPANGSAWRNIGSAPIPGRVLRGGSWYTFPLYLRAASRYVDTPDYRSSGIGFRVARTLS
jgi:formylglycine-generating enzyme required for sulfatase activity